MSWLLVSCLLTLASGFPFRTFEDWDKLGNFQVQAVECAKSWYPPCLRSAFLKQVFLPWVSFFFEPLETLNAGQQRCISTPLTTFGERNFGETSKEIIKEVETEAEKERLSDNTNIEVNGEEVEPGNFVKKENGVETKESKVEDKNVESKNKIIRPSEEIVEVSDENHSLEKTLPHKNFRDEDISISSNLV